MNNLIAKGCLALVFSVLANYTVLPAQSQALCSDRQCFLTKGISTLNVTLSANDAADQTINFNYNSSSATPLVVSANGTGDSPTVLIPGANNPTNSPSLQCHQFTYTPGHTVGEYTVAISHLHGSSTSCASGLETITFDISSIDPVKIFQGKILSGNADFNEFDAPDEPIEVALVLDGTGSMGSGANSKWESLKEATHLMLQSYGEFAWADAVSGTGANLDKFKFASLVFRGCSGADALQPLGDLFTAISEPPSKSADDYKISLDALSTAGCTSLWNAMVTGLDQFTVCPPADGSDCPKKVVLLLTDGMSNSGQSYSTFSSPLPGNTQKTFTVGLGTDPVIDPQDIRNWAILTDGNYRLTDDDLTLRSFFLEILGGVMNLERPIVESCTVTGLTQSCTVNILSGATKVLFIDNWSNQLTDASKYNFELSYDGTPISSSSIPTTGGFSDMEFRYSTPANDDKHAYWIVSNKTLTNQDTDTTDDDLEVLTGTWTINITIDTGIDLGVREQLSFVNPDKITSESDVKRINGQTGVIDDNIVLYTNVFEDADPVLNMDVKVNVSAPKGSVGHLLSQVRAPAFQTSLQPDLFAARLAHLNVVYEQFGADTLGTREYVVTLYDDGDPSHFDLIANDGLYSNAISPSLNQEEGTFTFEFEARGVASDGAAFSRTHTISERIKVAIDPSLTAATITNTAVNCLLPGHARTMFTFTPQGKRKLGPYRRDYIDLDVVNGWPVGSVIDNRDGSYSQIIEHQTGQNPVIELAIDDVHIGQFDVPTLGNIQVDPPVSPNYGSTLLTGGLLFDNDLELDNAVFLGTHFHYKFGHRFELSLEALWGQTKDRDEKLDYFNAINLGAYWRITNRRISPYLDSQVGLWGFHDLNAPVGQIGFGLGGGFDISLNERYSLRLGLRDYLLENEDAGKLKSNLSPVVKVVFDLRR